MPSVRVWLLPGLIGPDALRGGTVVVIDQLRATSTLTQALSAGVTLARPCVSVEEARRTADEARRSGRVVRTGGERAGVRIDGFDLGNSPSEYTTERLAGAELVFTTTNGTAALDACRRAGADRVLLACLANLAAVVGEIGCRAAPVVHLVCAGTNDEVSQDDALVAGAIAHALEQRAATFDSDDSVRLCARLWQWAVAHPDGVFQALRASRGGRNLERIGLLEDVRWCAQVDRVKDVVGEFKAADGLVSPVASLPEQNRL